MPIREVACRAEQGCNDEHPDEYGRRRHSPEQATEFAKLANDGMAELVDKHPDRFAGYVGALPMNAPDAAFAPYMTMGRYLSGEQVPKHMLTLAGGLANVTSVNPTPRRRASVSSGPA